MSDLVFHPSDDLRGASAEQIVDEALKYRPKGGAAARAADRLAREIGARIPSKS
ncbi:hypothetical protein AB0E04_41035 [Streptomyces sp. NPDC048251]|uniref:hypothetical protein n=1 Tax=Streptomyces sp. NPDC048251 TaxID=3154501 RepID=UPI00343E00BB